MACRKRPLSFRAGFRFDSSASQNSDQIVRVARDTALEPWPGSTNPAGNNGAIIWTGAMETIAAIYENGVFKPLRQVDLPEGTPVRVEAEDAKAGLAADLRKLLLAEGSTPEEATRIID